MNMYDSQLYSCIVCYTLAGPPTMFLVPRMLGREWLVSVDVCDVYMAHGEWRCGSVHKTLVSREFRAQRVLQQLHTLFRSTLASCTRI